MKALVAVAIWTALFVAANTSLAQSGHMMTDGGWSSGWMGGYGGVWMPLLLVLLVGGVIALLFQRRGK
jgi:hypothetical protein